MKGTGDTEESREASISTGPKAISRATIIAIIATVLFVIASSILFVSFYQNGAGGENSNTSTGTNRSVP